VTPSGTGRTQGFCDGVFRVSRDSDTRHTLAYSVFANVASKLSTCRRITTGNDWQRVGESGKFFAQARSARSAPPLDFGSRPRRPRSGTGNPLLDTSSSDRNVNTDRFHDCSFVVLYEKISEFGYFVSTDLPPRGYWLFHYHDGRHDYVEPSRISRVEDRLSLGLSPSFGPGIDGRSMLSRRLCN